jgi:hypothetical protein
MAFKLITREEMAQQEDRVSFNVELVGKDASAFKKALEAAEGKVSQKDAAVQMVRYCLKDAGLLKGE